LAPKSVLLYFTNLWASVATNVISSLFNSKNTPDITGLSSSFPVAKRVLLMAFSMMSALIFMVDGFSISGVLGNSSPFKPLSLYLPSSEVISIPKSFSSMVNVGGWLGKVFKVSNNNFAGIASTPFSLDSMVNLVDIVVSKSDAVTVDSPFRISNIKLSKLGSVLFVLNTPLICCNFSNETVLVTINFILYILYI